MTGRATVRVPATSANLGPGFDCLGLALALYDEVAVVAGDPSGGTDVDVRVAGEGVATVPRDARHLVVRAVHRAWDEIGEPRRPLSLTATNRIPHGRGLGSSAAAVVAGLLAGRALVADGPRRLDDDAVLALASEMEGHPDNAAACLLGGLTLAWSQPAGAVRAARLEPRDDLRVTALVPAAELSTVTARGLLPDDVPHRDAAFSAGRSALLVAVLTGAVPAATGALLAATEDRLHQPYRASAMPATAALVRSLRAQGRAAVVSGAGPTVLVLDTGTRAPVQVPGGWREMPVDVARAGAEVAAGHGGEPS